jgi:amino acid adenylation domain-containing protein/thioester reductase-like protein
VERQGDEILSRENLKSGSTQVPDGMPVRQPQELDYKSLAENALALTPPNLIEAHCEFIRPAMVTLVELDQHQIDSIVQTVPGGATNVQDIYPLTPLQEGMLFQHLLNEQSDTYVVSTLLELQSRTHLEALISALQTVIDRHDILRSAVLWEQLPRPVQVVYRWARLPVEELAPNGDRDPIEQLKGRMTPQQQKWDLRQAPLVRLQVGRDAGGTNWYALLQLHHVICDYGSFKTLIAEAMSHIEGRPQSVPEPLLYRTHVAQALAKARTHDAEEFFRTKLGMIDEPTAPFGLLDVHGDGTLLEEARRVVDPALAQRVRTQARQLGVTAARLIHAAWALVISRTSGKDEVVFGTVLSATRRRNTPAQPMLGMFANTLPLRLQLNGVTARELVEQTQRELGELLNYVETSLVVAHRCSGIVGSAPLFSSLLTYRHNIPNPTTEWSSAAGIRVLTAYQYRTSYPVTLTVDNLGEGFALIAQTDRRVDPNRVAGYVEAALLSLIDALERAPQTSALALSILPTSERHQVVELFNTTHVDYPKEKLIHALFEEQAERNPDAVAVEFEGQSLTYSELNRKANRLARYLRKMQGVGPDQLVALCVERSLEMMIGLLGILKAGAAYVPLDASYPVERLAYVLRDSTPVLLLTQERLKRSLPASDIRVLSLEAHGEEIEHETDENLDAAQMGLTPQHLAYVIYTSGSTGMPKGVMLEHGGLSNLAYAQMQSLDVRPHSRVLQFASLSFDACTWEWVMALCGGARLCLASRDALAPGDPLLQTLYAQKITHATLPPAALSAVLPCDGLQLSTLVVAGEVCPTTLVQQWAPGRRFINAYGPTEVTVCASMHECEPQDSGSVPIGRPIANTRIYILDRHAQPVPVGAAGELYIGGAGIARGYLNRPELTAERFVGDVFSADPRARLYKTGDLGRWRADGTIEYLGRNDHQVKIRGYRIELGEIEAVLLEHPAVQQSIVLAREDTPGERRLVAYVVGDRNAALETGSDRVPETLRHAIVNEWEALYERTYGTLSQTAAPSFVGWNSSYTDEPIREAHMLEWLSSTIRRIKSLKPNRVLEIGCGVGLLLQHLAPQCLVYIGTDLSASAIRRLRRWIDQREDLRRVELLHRSATEFQDLEAGSFDTVILNSVVQYFPDIDYLVTVLQGAVQLLRPGGTIFLGDIRHLGLLPMFHSAVQLSKASATVTVGQLRTRITRAVAQDKELVIDPQFFHALPGNLPGISAAEVHVKRGLTENELTRYRYDVTLWAGEQIGARAACEPLEWGGSTAELEAALSARRWRAVRLHGIPNQRLAREAACQRLIETSDEWLEVGALRLQLNELPFEEVHPETIWDMAEAHGYDVSLSPSEQGCFEACLLDRARADQIPREVSQPPETTKRWNAYANDPLENAFRQQLVPQLREHLKARLPEYMVPSMWMVLKQLPLTPNGKVDRRALPSPQGRREEMGEYIAPRTTLERTLADIWAQLLSVDQVGVQDNFFELGGHSLLIVPMMERLRRVGLSTSVRNVYENPTLGDLARRLPGEAAQEFTVPPNLIPLECEAITPQMLSLVELEPEHIERVVQSVPAGTINIQDIYPLLPLQEGMLFHYLMNEHGGDAYARSLLLLLSSREKLEDFVAAFQEVIDRHDILRTAILWDELPRPVQVVYRQATLPIEEIALDRNRDSIEQLKERMQSTAQRLNLRKAPLMRLLIAPEPRGAEWYALLETHHLVFDNESLRTMLAEVMACIDGRAQSLGEPVPYRNHVAQALAYARTSDADAFFRSKLGDIDEPTAPFGLLDVHGDGRRVDRVHQVLHPELAHRIRAQARRRSVSVATLFHAIWALVVARTSGREDVVFGSVLLGRLQGDSGAERTLGMFINTLPLRLKLQSVTASELIKQTQQELAELLNHEQASLALAQRSSRISGSAPLFTALLNYVRRSGDLRSDFSDTTGVTLLAVQGATNYPIVLTVYDQGEGFALEMETDHRIDSHRMIGYVSTAIQSLVEALERAPQRPTLSLKILPESERHQVIELFNATQAAYPRKKLIHELFEEHVKRTPAAVAVVHDGQSLTFAELNGKANQLARYLRDKGVGPDHLVGLCIERSLEMVVGLLGILKAGGGYVPLDPSYPTERLQYMLSDAAPKMLLIQEHLRARMPQTSAAQAFALDDEWSAVAREDASNLDVGAIGLHSHHLAYVIYTSGSTGQPKGVMVEHRSVVNLWHGLERVYGQSISCQHIALNASFNFDASVQQLVQLASGRAIFVVPEKCRRDAQMLMSFLRENQIGGIDCTPSQLRSWISAGLLDSSTSDLRVVLVGGEAIDTELWGSLAECHQINFYNVYGPTECTVDATVANLKYDAAPPHIGRPMENTRVYVVNSRGEAVPIRVTGEICIGGAGVARGYLNRPELTRERFITDPFSADPQARLYRTGDLGQWRPNGSIEYLGRNDHQVKIRGYRIELGEIEAQIARHAQVKEVLVIAREDVPGEKRLVAYVIPRDPSSTEGILRAELLRVHLKTVLPGHMVPSAFVMLENFPLTPSGKLDRRELPAPDLGAYASRRYEAPHGEAEHILAHIWQDLLHVERPGRRDNFFELGGHSLLALRLLFKVSHSFGITLNVTDVYKSPTLFELAARIGGRAPTDELIDLSKEAHLGDAIRATSGSRSVPVKTVLLTGCTGFVGRFLLEQLLRDTDATIHCLVRARSHQQATSRLRTTLVKWNLWRDEFERRIVTIPGDLGLPRLGINEATYRALADDVDSIYHCATSMNHLETYAMAKPTNVDGVNELLKLATHRKAKLFNYISTLGVFSSAGADNNRVVNERSPIENEKHPTSHGYVGSKWVGEALIMAASQRGIPCNIFRLGLVWADTQQGRYDERQREYRVYKSCLLSGYGIKNYRYEMAPTPVDYVARAVVFLSNHHSNGRGIFHISSSSSMVDGVFELCNEIAGTSLELLPFYEWICEIKRLHSEGNSLPAVPLVEFAFSMDEEAFYKHQRRIESSQRQFDSARTHQELECAGIVAPVLSDDLFRVYVENMFSRDDELRKWSTREQSALTKGRHPQPPERPLVRLASQRNVTLPNTDRVP